MVKPRTEAPTRREGPICPLLGLVPPPSALSGTGIEPLCSLDGFLYPGPTQPGMSLRRSETREVAPLANDES